MRQLVPLFALLALTACGKEKDTTTITTADGNEVKITSESESNGESGTITFEGKDGEGKITFGDAAAKQGLPLGLPVYPGGEVNGAFMGGNSGDGSAGGMATVVTSDAPAKVVAFYKAEAEKRGLKIETQASSSANMASFTAKGDGNASLVVTATPADNGGTAATIIGGSKN